MDNRFFEKVILKCDEVSFVERGMFLFLLKTDKTIIRDCIETSYGYKVTFSDGFDFLMVIDVIGKDGIFKCEVEELVGLDQLFGRKDVESIIA